MKTITKKLHKTNVALHMDSVTQSNSYYYSNLIKSNEDHSKTRFSLLNKIFQSQTSCPPTCTEQIPSMISWCFQPESWKKKHCLCSVYPPPSSHDELLHSLPFSSFLLPDASAISDLICKPKPTTWQLDPQLWLNHVYHLRSPSSVPLFTHLFPLELFHQFLKQQLSLYY